MRVLTGIAFSPWSEKAKWALDHHQVDYRYKEYTPFIGEYLLRLRMRNPSGFVTVPILRDGQSWLTDSLDIARHADRIGRGATLFPADKLREIERWNRRSDTALAAGRALVMLAVANNPSVSRAMLPKPLRAIFGPLAQKGLDQFVDKFRMREDADRHESVLRESLGELATALAEGREYLIGDALTYADIAMATAVQLVIPVDKRYMPSTPPGVKWVPNPERVERFAELANWRDNLYSKHRRRA